MTVSFSAATFQQHEEISLNELSRIWQSVKTNPTGGKFHGHETKLVPVFSLKLDVSLGTFVSRKILRNDAAKTGLASSYRHRVFLFLPGLSLLTYLDVIQENI